MHCGTLLLAMIIGGDASGKSDPLVDEHGGPYCGLYCVFAAGQILGADVDFAKLIDSRYVPTMEGSTISSLQLALANHGMRGDARRNLTIGHLAACGRPVILHTRAPGDPTGYHHWILVTGFDGDGVQIYDPPRATATIRPSELLSIWDGTGIIIGRAEDPRPFWIPPLESLSVGAAIIVCFRLLRASSRGMLQIAGTTGFALVLGNGVAYWTGMIEWECTTNVSAAYFHNRIPTIESAEEIASLTTNDGVVIVDARSASAYFEGHISNAVNVPVYLGFLALREKLSMIPKKKHIIVYCLNERCAWSDQVAQQFSERGYHRVSVFRPGIVAWEQWVRKGK